MKVKKIITAASCAALIAAAALPLTACGGAKKLETTGNLSLDSYAVTYESKYNTNLAAPMYANIATSNFVSFYNYNGDNKYFYVSKRNDTNSGYVDTYYTKNCGYIVAEEGDYSNVVIVEDGDGEGRFISYISEKGEDENTVIAKCLHGEDGSLLIDDAYVGEDFDNISEVEFYEGDNEEKSKFICVDYTTTEHKSERAYFKYIENEDGSRYYNNNKVDVSTLKAYSAEYAAGRNVFGAEVKLANYYDNVWNDAVSEYSVQRIGNEMVFRNGGEETGRVNMDGVNNYVFAGEIMLYTKLVALPEGDKNANLIKPLKYSDGYYSYELHSYSITKNKDKKLPNYGIAIDEMAPLYNHGGRRYDAIAISGAKLDGKKYQSGSTFQYIMDPYTFKIAFDATGLPSFTDKTNPARFVRGITAGDYFVLSKEYVKGRMEEVLTPVDGSLNRLIATTTLAKDYYSYENMFRVQSERGAYGFVDLAGNVIASPIYLSESYDGNIQIYGDRAYVYNTVTHEYVFLDRYGKETSAPQNVTTVSNGWYYKESFDETKKLELFSFDGTLIKTYDNVDDYDFVIGNKNLMGISFTDGEYEKIIIQIS